MLTNDGGWGGSGVRRGVVSGQLEGVTRIQDEHFDSQSLFVAPPPIRSCDMTARPTSYPEAWHIHRVPKEEHRIELRAWHTEATPLEQRKPFVVRTGKSSLDWQRRRRYEYDISVRSVRVFKNSKRQIMVIRVYVSSDKFSGPALELKLDNTYRRRRDQTYHQHENLNEVVALLNAVGIPVQETVLQ